MHDPVGSVPVLQNLEATNEPSGLCVCVCYRFYVGINREFAAADSVHPSNDDEYHPDRNGHIFYGIDIFFNLFIF